MTITILVTEIVKWGFLFQNGRWKKRLLFQLKLALVASLMILASFFKKRRLQACFIETIYWWRKTQYSDGGFYFIFRV